MIIYIILGIATVTAIVLGAIALHKSNQATALAQKRLELQKTEFVNEAKDDFIRTLVHYAQLSGTLHFEKPNGSATSWSNIGTKLLTEKGYSMFVLDPAPIKALVSNDSDQSSRPDISLDFIVIGTIVEKEVVKKPVTPRRHIHTPSGQFFHMLDRYHSDLRRTNINYDPSEEQYKGLVDTFGIHKREVYFEPLELFKMREEREKAQETRVTHYTLDFKICKPGGLILLSGSFQFVDARGFTEQFAAEIADLAQQIAIKERIAAEVSIAS